MHLQLYKLLILYYLKIKATTAHTDIIPIKIIGITANFIRVCEIGRASCRERV